MSGKSEYTFEQQAENGKKAAEELMDQFDTIISKYELDAHYVVGVISNVFALAAAECGTPDGIFDDVCGWVKSDFVKFKAMIEAAKDVEKQKGAHG